jgi:hypothetical protein
MSERAAKRVKKRKDLDLDQRITDVALRVEEQEQKIAHADTDDLEDDTYDVLDVQKTRRPLNYDT